MYKQCYFGIHNLNIFQNVPHTHTHTPLRGMYWSPGTTANPIDFYEEKDLYCHEDLVSAFSLKENNTSRLDHSNGHW